MSMYLRPSDLDPPPACVVCGARIDVDTQPIPGTERVLVVMATCPTDVTHNPANSAALGGRLESLATVPG